MNGLITSSRLRVFRRCRREHHLRYTLGRTTAATAAQDFGTLVHVGLEAWWLATAYGADRCLNCKAVNRVYFDTNPDGLPALKAKNGEPIRCAFGVEMTGEPGAERCMECEGRDFESATALEAAVWAMHHSAEGVDPFDLARAEAMLIGYDARWGDEQYEVLGVEQEFRATLDPDPAMVRGTLSANMLRRVADLKRNGRWGRCGFCPDDPAQCENADRYDHKLTREDLDRSLGWQMRKEMLGDGPVRLGGKLDAVVRDSAGRVLIVEHKTSSEDISTGSAYWARLRLDGQVSLYYLGAEALGYEVSGVLYDVLGKPGAKPLKASAAVRMTKGKTKRCPDCKGKMPKPNPRLPTPIICATCNNMGEVTEAPRPMAGQRLTDETPDEYKARIVEALAADPDRYFQRLEVVRLEGERQRHLEELRAEVRELQAAAPLPNPDACTRYGSTCAFFPLCTGERTLDEYPAAAWPHPELTEDK